MGPCHQQHQIISLQHGRNGATLPASSTLLLSQGEEIQAHCSIGTAQLRHRDTTAETQAGSAGAMSTDVVPEGLGTAVAWLTGLSLPLTYRHLHSHTASKPPPDT